MTDSYMIRDKLVTTLVWHVNERGLYGVFTLPDKETDTKTDKNGLYRIYHYLCPCRSLCGCRSVSGSVDAPLSRVSIYQPDAVSSLHRRHLDSLRLPPVPPLLFLLSDTIKRITYFSKDISI